MQGAQRQRDRERVTDRQSRPRQGDEPAPHRQTQSDTSRGKRTEGQIFTALERKNECEHTERTQQEILLRDEREK